MDVKKDDIIGEIKADIAQAKSGSNQKLFFKGEEMNDRETLNLYNVQEGDILQCIFVVQNITEAENIEKPDFLSQMDDQLVKVWKRLRPHTTDDFAFHWNKIEPKVNFEERCIERVTIRSLHRYQIFEMTMKGKL